MLNETFLHVQDRAKLKEIVPTLEKPWAEYEILCQEIREWTSDVLELNA